MYHTILTAIDNHGGKTFFSASGTTEQKSIDKALENFVIGRLDQEDSIHKIVTWDNIKDVSPKLAR